MGEDSLCQGFGDAGQDVRNGCEDFKHHRALSFPFVVLSLLLLTREKQKAFQGS